ncbi:MAG: FG-GAP-like repeat-containing protein, partial [Bacteroidota bacterium]
MMQHVHSMNPNRRQSDLYSKWRKLQQRINRNLETGRFHQFTKRKQQQLLKRLRRYAQQLKSLGVPMKRLALGGALALSMAVGNGAQAQSYLEVTGEDNPFNAISVGYEAEPALADMDGDGDLDLFVAELYGTVLYFTNIGTAMSPSFEATMGENNPLDGVNNVSLPKIALADVDGDGDFDALLGNNYGELFYYQNTGSAAEPTFTAITGADNPFEGISVNYYSVPTFSDIDGDGDLDLIVGDYYGNLNYFQNTGSSTAPAYAQQSGMDNPLDGIIVSGEAAPTFGDVDDDGDLDAFLGSYDGSVSFVMNMGTSTEPMFMLQSGADNPLDGIGFGNYSKPALADMDGDGDPDLLVGTSNGAIRYF